MNVRLLVALAAILPWLDAFAQTPRDFAIDLKAEVASSVPRITLRWTQRQQSAITGQQVYRRLKGEVNWNSLATLSTTQTSYADTTAEEGIEYEYWMRRTYSGISPSNALGYINAGVNVPMQEHRGTLLLVVDDTMIEPLGEEVVQLYRDLIGDGWTVQLISASRSGTAIDTKALIKSAYDADPGNVKQVYLLGHVPVPYSGNSAWDAHSNHSGAWSADTYYGDMDGIWTDSSVNNGSTANTRVTNVPGDGRFDQSTIPSSLELMVGRVDLANMQRAPSTAASEVALLRRYLRRAHDFRHKQGAYADVERRVLIRDGFGVFGSESFMRTGWAWGFTTVGQPPEVTFDQPSGNWWTLAATNKYLMAHGNGGGSYETCGSVGATADFGRRPFRAVFLTLFGSYFGDWDTTNNFLRAPLAGNATGDGLALCSIWAGRPTWFMHHMSMGETIGYTVRQSMNSQFSTVSNPVYTPVNSGSRGTHCGLMGDPSLRMHVVEPPRDLTATSSNGTVNLAWSASSESNLLGYHVYRAHIVEGPYSRLTSSPLLTSVFADSTGTSSLTYTYMVRTLKLERSPGGTYENLSQGAMATIRVSAGATPVPKNATRLTVTPIRANAAQLTWQDNAPAATGYRVQRKSVTSGTFGTLATLGPGSSSFTDPGPFANNVPYYYRVVALGSSVNSITTDEVSFEATAGFFEFDVTTLKANRAQGVASVPVKRFGGINGVASVSYATANSSALAGTDYLASSGTITWADGESGSKLIEIPLLSGSPRGPRQFRLTLSNPSNGTGIGTYNAVAVLIEDPAATLAAPWAQSTVGGVTDFSPARHEAGAIVSATIGGSGLVTAATAESGRFIYQTRTGDGVMTAMIPASVPAQTGARCAIMVRESATSGGARMAGTATSSSTGFGSKFVYRTAAASTAVFTGDALSSVTPRWVRLTRTGDVFSSECSPDGVAWTYLGAATVPMSTTAQWGLFHHSDGLSGTTYAGNFQTTVFQDVTFAPLSAPQTPGSFASTPPTATRVTLNWAAVPAVVSYHIERRTENGSFVQVGTAPASTLTFSDDTVAANTGYAYRIVAMNAAGVSSPSVELRVTTPAPDVQSELVIGSTASSGDAAVRASATTTNFGSDSLLTVAGFSDTGSLSAASKIYLRFDLEGITTTMKSATLRLAVAEARNFASSDNTFDGYVYVLPDTQDGWSETNITWANAPLNHTGSVVFLSGAVLAGSLSIWDASEIPAAGSVAQINLTTEVLNSNKGTNGIVSLAMTTFTSGAALDFAAREHATLPAPTLAVTHASPLPIRPSFLTGAATGGAEIELQWADNSSNESGFEIERRVAGGAFGLIQTTGANAVSFTDPNTVAGSTYEYRVRAASAAGPSAWSLIVAATAGSPAGHSTGVTTYAAWLQENNQPANLPGAADLDGDGLPNLVEYALGLSVGWPGADGMPGVGVARIGEEDVLTLTFSRRIDATDVVLRVEAADSPAGPWESIDPFIVGNQFSTIPDSPRIGWQTLVIRDSVALAAAPQRVMRLRVTKP